MAGGEPRLGTDSMYMGNHNSLLRSLQPIICQLHGYKNRTSENKIARYQPLDVKERRKLRLAVQNDAKPQPHNRECRFYVEPADGKGKMMAAAAPGVEAHLLDLFQTLGIDRAHIAAG